MITAQEAKALYDQSGAEVAAYLKNVVEPKVIAASKSGKRRTEILLGAKPRGHSYNVGQVLVNVVAELRKLGYVAKIESYGEYYVPRGLADDNGFGTEHQNYGIVIGW